jgi:hypothetical protein
MVLAERERRSDTMFQRPYNPIDDEESRAEFAVGGFEEKRIAGILKRLRPGSGSHLEDPELWREVTRMFFLLRRIEELVDQEYDEALVSQHNANPDYSSPSGRDEEAGGYTRNEFADLQPFQPLEFSSAFERFERPGVLHHDHFEPRHAAPEAESPVRWWVSFSGDVSLERLSRLRTIIDESPLTIDAHFHEIGDGLIVMRVTTDNSLTMEQLEWTVQQVMDTVGVSRNAAIVSRS